MEFLQTRIIFDHLDKTSHDNGSSMSCIAKDCRSILLELNCSSARAVVNKTCHESSDPEIPLVLWSISAFILFLLVLELVAIRFKYSLLDNFFGKLVFSMGIVSSTVTQFCTMHYVQENSNEITVWYNVVLGIITILFMGFGFQFLFEKAPDNNIGSHDRGMGLVVVIVSTCLVSLETVLIIMVFKKETLSDAFAILLIVFTSQKVVQVFLYVLVRRCNPRENFKRGAVFYFYFLSYVNFSLWVNSIPFADIQIYDEVSHSHALRYVDQTFKALVIDYRLLCCLLFLEHALVISDEQPHANPHRQVNKTFPMPRKHYFFTIIGVGIGLCCLALEVLNGAQYWHQSLPKVMSLFPMLVDAFLVVLGYLLLRNVNTAFLHNRNVSLVLFMVTGMGVVGVVYLFCFGLLSLTSFQHDTPVSFVRWSACVFLSRGASLLALLLVYTGIPVSTMELRANHNTKNYILVSALCAGLFARFIGCVLDEFHGEMHKIAHHHLESNKLRSLQGLFEIGPLFQLAASLHLALHFLVMICRSLERPGSNDMLGEGSAIVEKGRDSFPTTGIYDLEVDGHGRQTTNEHTPLIEPT